MISCKWQPLKADTAEFIVVSPRKPFPCHRHRHGLVKCCVPKTLVGKQNSLDPRTPGPVCVVGYYCRGLLKGDADLERDPDGTQADSLHTCRAPAASGDCLDEAPSFRPG